MNNLKEIEVTDSFFELERDIRKCQNYKNKDTYDTCTTRFLAPTGAQGEGMYVCVYVCVCDILQKNIENEF